MTSVLKQVLVVVSVVVAAALIALQIAVWCL